MAPEIAIVLVVAFFYLQAKKTGAKAATSSGAATGASGGAGSSSTLPGNATGAPGVSQPVSGAPVNAPVSIGVSPITGNPVTPVTGGSPIVAKPVRDRADWRVA